MRKIVVIGAGIGGLYAASELAKVGYDVTVFELKARADLGYPWYDSVKPTTFKDVKLDIPEEVFIPKQVLNYYAPSGESKIKQPDRAGKSLDVHREKLIQFLLARAEEHATLCFGKKVTSLAIVGNAVKGVMVDGERVSADLVIDSSGLFSPCRTATPDSFLLNDPVQKNDYIVAYREVYTREGSEEPAPNVYLYPAGLMLAWAKSEPDYNGVDVFLGGYGEITKEGKEKALTFLKKHNPCLGDRLLDGRKETVPLRYPLGILAANGYAVVGNAAFMTQPFCGSGIEVSLKAAMDLVSVVKGVGLAPFSAENLWKYTFLFMKRFGAYYAAQYAFRQAVETLSPDDLDFIFSSGLFDQGIVALATFDKDHIKSLNFRSFVQGFRATLQRKDIVSVVMTAVNYAIRAYLTAQSLPKKYEAEKVAAWKDSYDSFLRAVPNEMRKVYEKAKK